MKKETITILAIDDDQDDLDIFCEAVRDVDSTFDCQMAHSGQEALTLLSDLSFSPKVIFLDYNMPGMTGKDLLNTLRANERFDNIPVVMYSTYIGDADRPYYAERKAYVLHKLDDYTGIVKQLGEILKGANKVL